MDNKKRLIDANELIDSLKEWLSASNVVCDWDVYHTIEDCICEVNAQPTVDAVEVVRCKDCENWMYEYDDVGLCVVDVPDVDGVQRLANDFCSYGERKD